MRAHLSPVLCLGAVLVALEATLLEHVRIQGVAPDLSLLLALFLSLHLPFEHALGANWLLGLLHDFPSVAGFGTSALLYLLLGALVSLLKEILFRDSLSVQVLLVFAASFLYNLAYGGCLARTQEALRPGDVLARSAAIATYTALVGPLAFAVLHRFRRLFVDARVV
ncbi:MAG: rod shape-determining protein MreD [Planctomycetes bacterium]|nr:rod shape-determining protein MreD [Planctomycetota bacterium]